MTKEDVSSSTYLERLAIDAQLNLSDGHARQLLTPAEANVVANFGRYYPPALAMSQSAAEQQMSEEFFRLAGESTNIRTLYSYSASSLVAVVASWLCDRRVTVALLEPGFDNIRDLLIRGGATLTPIRAEDVLALPGHLVSEHLPRGSAALWLTLPNNPDGYTLTCSEFESLTNECAANDILLICDFCFRLFSERMAGWSQYEYLTRSGCRFIAFEDTGKTLPLLDIKVGMLRCSSEFADDLTRRNEELVLNVSPWAMGVIAKLLQIYGEAGLATILWEPTRRRGKLVEQWIDATGLRNMGSPDGEAPFKWIGLPDEFWLNAQDLSEAAAKIGVHILPGCRFFFDRRHGRRLMRIPLSRPDSMLEAGLARLQSVISQH